MTRRLWPLALTLLTLVVANLLTNRLFPNADALIGIALTVALLAIAYRAGTTAEDLGLDSRNRPRGLRWGLGAVVVVAVVYTVAWLLPAVRADVTPSAQTWPQALLTAFVAIPLATAIPEELAFRGLLLALLRVRTRLPWATVISSVLFAVWHLLPSLSGSAANVAADEAAASAGVGAGATVLRVAGTLLVTACGGVVLCELRRRSNSQLAPIAAHWAINGLGVLFVMLA
jgi:membrane protease YdiL (CAAX protease family)